MNKNYIIIEGDSYENALNDGLSKLNLTKNEVEVEILEEKRGYIFRKPYIKLKLIPKQNGIENSLLKKIDELNKEIEIQDNLLDEESFFHIDYLPDGIYITITKTLSRSREYKINRIINYLEKKSVTEFDIDIINKCIDEEIADTPFKIAPYQKEKLIDGDVLIDVSKDGLQAYLMITEADGGKDITMEEVKLKLEEKNIAYGVDHEQILNIFENRLFDKKVLIANGQESQDGEDGKVKYHFHQGKKHKPKALEDGTVDFKDLNLITNVKSGQLLIEIIPPTDGVPGIDVFGKEISNKKGKKIKIAKGKNVVENEEGLKIYAATDGQVFLKNGKIEVSKVYEVPGDVDTSTGNIKFNGKVVVKGNVKSGFSVDADGDIEVNGVVESSTLIAKGNIILNRGVQGNNQAYLECSGNLIARYIENSTIKCLGNIEADCILHSNVVAGLNIIVSGKKSLIVGGHIRSGEEIRAKIIGSHMGTATNLEVGIDPNERIKYEEINEEIGEIEKNLSNLKKTIQLLTKLEKESNLSRNKKEILIKSIKTNEYLQDKHSILSEEKEALEFKMQNLSRGKIHVSGIMYPGTKITILNAVRHVYDEISNSTLYRKEGEVVIGPYEK